MNNLNFQVFASLVVQMVVIFCAFMPCADLSFDVSEEHTTSIFRYEGLGPRKHCRLRQHIPPKHFKIELQVVLKPQGLWPSTSTRICHTLGECSIC